MKQTTFNHNPTFGLVKRFAFSAILAASFSFLVNSNFYDVAPSKINKLNGSSYKNTLSRYYIIESVKIGSNNFGEGVINLDSYRVPFTFNFNVFNKIDKNLRPDLIELEIDNLEIGQITTHRSEKVSDFTQFEDHLKIISQLKAYITQNNKINGILQ